MPKNEKVIIIEGSRSGYSLDQVNYPITVGELIELTRKASSTLTIWKKYINEDEKSSFFYAKNN